MKRNLLPAVVVGLLWFGGQGRAAVEAFRPTVEDYENLREWAFSASPVDLPPEGLHWQIDTAEWHLDSGQIWLQRPTSGGQVTGFVFAGSGRFEMAVPDPVELRQLRRFAKDPLLESLVESFDGMVVRGVGVPFVAALPSASGSSYKSHRLARDRHDHWLSLRRIDVDARIVAALARTADTYLRVDMRTDGRGWLTYELDHQRTEEISVEWFNPRFDFLEQWLSLDRPEERLADGRPSGKQFPTIDIEHVSIRADITEYAKESPEGVAKIRPTKAKIQAAVRFQALVGGDSAIQLFLTPWAKVERVTDDSGDELPFIRFHMGKQSSTIDNKIFDDSLLVLLSQPLIAGERVSVVVNYELDASGYMPGRLWYPSAEVPGMGLLDRHTGHLVVESRDEFVVRGMGEMVDESLEDDSRVTSWTIPRPVKMMTFVFARASHEESFEAEGLPEVRAFSSLGGFVNEERVRLLGADVVNSVDYFQTTFESKIQGESLLAALIPAGHGQAFDGLLHIGDFSVVIGRVFAVERFRAHEVAHEWWGHRVGWNGYRNQWLSEGFAEYSAMMFVESTVDGGPRYFREMLEAYVDELTGSQSSTFSQFSRPGVTRLNMQAVDRIGPIGHGWRCVVGEARTAHSSQLYKKGALVLHMLRMLLRTMTGSDEAFLRVLSIFADRFEGRYATTADFEAVVTEVLPADWSWFFDAWVFSAEIPTYRWSYRVAKSDQGQALKLHVEQSDVSPGFKMAVPVEIQFRDGRVGTVLAFVDKPEKDFEFPLSDKPTKVVFNPDHAVLARVKKDK
jgi:hypothetical protein